MQRVLTAPRTGLWWHEPDHTKLETGHGIKGVWVEPTPHLIIGDVKKWAVQADVEPMRIPGYWLDKEGYDTPVGAPRKPGEKVLYVLHGGGYTRLSGHPNDEVANVARGILKHTGPAMRRAFSLEFRLTKDPGTKPYFPFPAALIDAVAAYSYLIHDVGFTPQDIILEGDSAGGHLAISLVRYLVENRAGDATFIPLPPSSLILASPWVDLGPAPSDPSSSAQANIPSDHLNIANRGTQVLISHICGPLGRSAAVTNRYISPASTAATMEPMSFAGFPRTCIIAGGAEVSLDQIRVLHQKMKADLRSDLVKYIEMPDAIHDFLTKLWYEPERTECLRILGEWIEAG